MAKKTPMRGEYIGARLGGYGYYVKRCSHCGEKVYLMEGSELEGILVALKAYHFQLNVVHYFRKRLHLPKVKLDWQ